MERVGDGHAFGGCADVSKNSTQARIPPRTPGKKQCGHPGHALNVRPTGTVAARGFCVSEVVEREGRAAIVLK